MKGIISTKSLTLVLGVSLCGVTGYLLYLLFKNDDDDDDFNNTIPKSASYKTSQVRVPNSMVRILIGRNGKNIKSIEEQSNTRIYFKDNKDDSDHMCIIKGSVEGCNIAENLIYEFIQNQPVLECVDIWVPQMSVGKIIGRCGEQITEICSMSGAKINVSDERSDLTRRITIKGTKKQINLAKSYIDEIVENVQIRQMSLDTKLAKREPRLPPKSAENSKSPITSPRVERISPLPGQTDAQFEVYVSAMVDPSHFWLQIVGPKATELDLLVEEMTEYYGKDESKEMHALTHVQEGDLVAAEFQYDNKWYRAEVLKIIPYESYGKDAKAELYYVDYGDTDTVPVQNLYELRTDFLRLHFQAIECYLAKIEPVGANWCAEAVDRFEEWTHVAQWKKLSAKINGYAVRDKTRAKREGSPVPGVDLFDVNNDQDLDIAQELVKHGFAIYKKEELRTSSRATSVSNNSVDSLS